MMRQIELSEDEMVGIYASIASLMLASRAIEQMTSKEREEHREDVARIEGWMAATDFKNRRPEVTVAQMMLPIMRKLADVIAPKVE